MNGMTNSVSLLPGGRAVSESSSSLATEPLTLGGGGINNSGALRNVSGANTFAGPLTLTGATRINSEAGTLTLSSTLGGAFTTVFGGDGNIVVSGVIGTGGGSVHKADGLGNVTLSGANTFTGGMTVSAGTVTLGNALAAGTGLITVIPGANLTLSAAATVSNLAGNGGTVNLGANQLTLNGTSTNNFYGQILGTGLILKQNTGTQTLSGPVFTTGGVTVDNGTLAFGSTTAFTATGTSGTSTLAASAAAGLVIGQVITGTGIDAGTVITAISGTTVTLSKPLSAAASGNYSALSTYTREVMTTTGGINTFGALRIGSADTITTAGNLNFANISPTFSSFTIVNGRSATIAAPTVNSVVIGAGRTLNILGDVKIGNTFSLAGAASGTPVGAVVTNFTGGGNFYMNGTNFWVGTANGTTDNNFLTQVDMSALTSFTAILGTGGVFAVDYTGNNGGGTVQKLVLAGGSNTIQTGTLVVGNSGLQGLGNVAVSGQHTLNLGAGTNTLYATTVNLGVGGRAGGNLQFNSAAGTLVLRDATGIGRAALNMGNNTNTTGSLSSANLLLAGHNVDVLFGAINMYGQTRAGASANTITFDQGIFDAYSITMAGRTSAA